MEQKVRSSPRLAPLPPETTLAALWDYRTSPLFSEAERVALDFALAAGSVPNDVTEEMFAGSAGKHAH